MFGTKHLIILALSLIFISVIFYFTRKIKLKKLSKALFIIGIISEIIKIFFYTIKNEESLGGYLPKTDLPFQLCSIQIIFITIINLYDNEKVKRFLYSFMAPSCLLGALAAILIPVYSALNFTIITFQYFIYHNCLIIYALHLFTSKDLKLNINDYFNCLKFLLVLMFFAIYINSICYDGQSNVNFMYVVAPPQDGLPYLNNDNGWFVYIIHYAILVLSCITVCYIKPIISAIKNKFSNKNNTLNEITTNEQNETNQ